MVPITTAIVMGAVALLVVLACFLVVARFVRSPPDERERAIEVTAFPPAIRCWTGPAMPHREREPRGAGASGALSARRRRSTPAGGTPPPAT
jgi:hypothetical protein